jgi:hypothetical protein
MFFRAVLPALALLAATSGGCAGLIVRDSAPAGAKAAKIGTRVGLAAVSLGISEGVMGKVKRRDAQRELHDALRAAVGIMTIDEAVSTWGPPSGQFDGDEVAVFEWRSEAFGAVSAPIGNTVFTRPVRRGEVLRLTFDRRTKVLRDWFHERY